jgi:hypothetical protein
MEIQCLLKIHTYFSFFHISISLFNLHWRGSVALMSLIQLQHLARADIVSRDFSYSASMGSSLLLLYLVELIQLRHLAWADVAIGPMI